MSVHDFERDVWCLLGVPVDNISMDALLAALRAATHGNAQLFLSTANLNYIAAAWRNAEFRESLIESNLTTADGMPLVWAARLIGIPLRERVAGSDAMQRILETRAAEPFTIFFFGGEQSVAEQACRVINAHTDGGLRALGFVFPGYGTVEDMSADAYLSDINRHQPDLLSVSIGATKAQIWLRRNRSKLNAKVVVHLGAVINFFAGSVRRAPRWMRKTGFEWAWRIIQEPALWQRYWLDGMLVLKLIASRSLPYWFWSQWRRRKNNAGLPAADCMVHLGQDQNVLQLAGDCVATTVSECKEAFVQVATAGLPCRLDLSAVTDLDPRFIGLILVLRKNLGPGQLRLAPVSPIARRLLRWNCADYLLAASEA